MFRKTTIIKGLIILLVVGILATLGWAGLKITEKKEEIKTQPIEEKYVRKELISFSWGSGKYQLGSNWREFLDENLNYIGPEDAWSESRGPDKIIINKKGEIFIGDPLNNRTVIFNPQNNEIAFNNRFVLYSTPICFDEDGNLYIGEKKILKFDSQLKFIEEIVYEPLKPSEFQPKYISIGKDRNFYLFSAQGIIVINPKDKKIKKQINDRFFEFLPVRHLHKKLLTVVKEEIQNEVIKEKKISVVYPQSLKENEIDLNLKGRYGWVSEIIGEDKYNNTFLLVGVAPSIGEVKEKGRYMVQVYNYKGNFLTEISLDEDDRLHFNQKTLLTIDDEGNIYHLWIQKEGSKLIKWGKQK